MNTTTTTEEARWLLEGSHGKARDAKAAVVLLEEKAKNNDSDAMLMLGVCCEFGMGTEQDVKRAEQLYKQAAQQQNTTAQLLVDKLKNDNGRGCTNMKLSCEHNKSHHQKCIHGMIANVDERNVQRTNNRTGQLIGDEGANVLSAILKMGVSLTKLDLRGEQQQQQNGMICEAM